MTSSLVDDFKEKFGERAIAIDGEWRRHRAAIMADGNLSDQGKSSALEDADTRRREAVDRLTGEAQVWARWESKTAHDDLAKVKAATAQARRNVLGDLLLADIEHRRFAMLAPAEMLAMADNAPDAWHKTLYSELADLALRERATSGDVAAEKALAELGSIIPPDVRELESALSEFERTGDTLLGDLDATAHRQRIADAYGVNAEFVETRSTGHDGPQTSDAYGVDTEFVETA